MSGSTRIAKATACCLSCKESEKTAKCKEMSRIDVEGKGRKSIKFVKKDPDNRILSNSSCDASQRAEVMASVKKAERTLKKAYRKWD